MSTTPFAIAAQLQIPGDTGLPADPIPFNVSSQYTSESSQVLNLIGAGTKSIGLGSIAGVTGLLIKVDASATAQPIQVKINGSATGLLEIAPGGGLLYANPNPAAPITQLDVIYPTSCIVRVWALGQ